jgi:hypothetical protein
MLVKQKGFRYTVVGAEDINIFAKGVLALANSRSNKQGVIDFRTYVDSLAITVLSEFEIDDYITEFVGKIEHKERTAYYMITVGSLNRKAQKQYERLEDTEYTLNKDEF